MPRLGTPPSEDDDFVRVFNATQRFIAATRERLRELDIPVKQMGPEYAALERASCALARKLEDKEDEI